MNIHIANLRSFSTYLHERVSEASIYSEEKSCFTSSRTTLKVKVFLWNDVN